MQRITCLVGLTRRMQILHTSSFKEQIRPMCKYSAAVKSKPPPWEYCSQSCQPRRGWPESKVYVSRPRAKALVENQQSSRTERASSRAQQETASARDSSPLQEPETSFLSPKRPVPGVSWLPFLISCHLSLEAILIKFIKKAQVKAPS
jgi:hypothetical protein